MSADKWDINLFWLSCTITRYTSTRRRWFHVVYLLSNSIRNYRLFHFQLLTHCTRYYWHSFVSINLVVSSLIDIWSLRYYYVSKKKKNRGACMKLHWGKIKTSSPRVYFIKFQNRRSRKMKIQIGKSKWNYLNKGRIKNNLRNLLACLKKKHIRIFLTDYF